MRWSMRIPGTKTGEGSRYASHAAHAALAGWGDLQTQVYTQWSKDPLIDIVKRSCEQVHVSMQRSHFVFSAADRSL